MRRTALPALPALLILLAGCAESPDPPAQADFEWRLADLDGLDIPVLFVNGTARYDGQADFSRFIHIADDRDGTEPFLVDAANRTVWFRYPDVVWQGCGMAGVVLVSQAWHSPLSDWRQWTAYFQPQSGRTVLELGSAPAFARVSADLGSLKMETAARNGDSITVADGQPGKHWDIIQNRTETGRLGPSTYERVELRFRNHLEFKHGGLWSIRPHPELVAAFSEGSALEDYWLASEYPESPYCHRGT